MFRALTLMLPCTVLQCVLKGSNLGKMIMIPFKIVLIMRKSNRAKRGNKRGARDFSAKQRTCRASGREVPYLVNSVQGTGGLLIAQTGVLTPATGSDFVIIVPESIGPRCAQLARLYHQYRINSLSYVYRPRATDFAMTSSSNLNTQTGANAGGTQSSAVMGFSLDPALGTLTQSEVIEQGGRWMNLARGSSIKYTNSKWLYTQPTIADAAPDNRFISIGNLHFAEASGGVSGNLYGYLEVHWDISFRYPVDADTEVASTPFVGETLRTALQTARDEAEKKFEEKKVPLRKGDTPVLVEKHYADDDCDSVQSSRDNRVRMPIACGKVASLDLANVRGKVK